MYFLREKILEILAEYLISTNNKEFLSAINDKEDIEWITVKGNHIPVKKGQTREEAIKEFIKSKRNDSDSDYISDDEAYSTFFDKHVVKPIDEFKLRRWDKKIEKLDKKLKS